jgi:hypothetical protein
MDYTKLDHRRTSDSLILRCHVKYVAQSGFTVLCESDFGLHDRHVARNTGHVTDDVGGGC